MLPFKDQKSADSVRRQLRNLSKTIGRQIQSVYTSRKIAADFPAAETKPPLWISNVLFIYSNVICATQIMSVTLADTYINALMNTSHRLSENIWFNSMARTQRTSGKTLRYWENVGESSSVYSMKCYLLKILNLV
jgi:hypothetical protein